MKLFYRVALCSLLGIALQADNSSSFAIAQDKNDNLVVGGSTDRDNQIAFALARIQEDGTADQTFNAQGERPGQVTTLVGETNAGINAIAIDVNNKIVVAGFAQQDFTSSFALGRYNEDGSLDTTFNANNQLAGGPGIALIGVSLAQITATGVVLDSLGRIVAVGTSDNGVTTDVVVVRLTPAGELDETFNEESLTPGIRVIDVRGTNDAATAVVVDQQNAIYIAGSSNNMLDNDFLLIKLLEDGSFDESFNAFSLNPGIILEDIRETDDVAFALGIDVNNNITLGGFSSDGTRTDFALAQYLPDGQLNEAFNAAGTLPGRPGTAITSITGNDDAIRSLAFDSQNRIVVTGFSTTEGERSFTTARYNPNGSLDTSFNVTGAQQGIVITTIVPDQDRLVLNNDSMGHGIIVGKDDVLFVTGVSNDGVQNNFTTINYLASGQLNTANFNTNGLRPGIRFTLFGPREDLRGNGVPLILQEDISRVSPEIIEDLTQSLEPILPAIDHVGPLLTSDFQPTLQGVASPSNIVTLLVNDVSLLSVVADRQGYWSATLPALVDGTYTISIVTTDPLSGVTLASEPVSLTILTEAPQPPEIQPLPVVLKTPRVTIQGTAQPNMMIDIFIDSRLAAEVSSGTGTWSYTFDRLSNGKYSVFAVARNTVDLASLPSMRLSFTVDTEPERAPRIQKPINLPLITGQGKPNSTIILRMNNKKETIPVNSKGQWKYILQGLKPGNYLLKASTEDESRSSESVPITIEAPKKRVSSF